MRLIAIETENGLLFRGAHAQEVERVTGFRCDEDDTCVVPVNALFSVFPKLSRAGHSVGVLNPFVFIPQNKY